MLWLPFDLEEAADFALAPEADPGSTSRSPTRISEELPSSLAPCSALTLVEKREAMCERVSPARTR